MLITFFSSVFVKCYISYNHLDLFRLVFFFFMLLQLVCFCCILLVLRILVSFCVLCIYCFPFSSLSLSLLLDIHIKVTFFVFLFLISSKFLTLFVFSCYFITHSYTISCAVFDFKFYVSLFFFVVFFFVFFLLHNTLQLPERGAGWCVFQYLVFFYSYNLSLFFYV